MTEYLKKYMERVENGLASCKNRQQLEKLLAEHKDKIVFMQHERLVHFLVTMMFAVILVLLMIGFLLLENMLLSVLVVIILILLGAYIKHYYFLENTVQKMYVIYDKMLEKAAEYADKKEEQE